MYAYVNVEVFVPTILNVLHNSDHHHHHRRSIMAPWYICAPSAIVTPPSHDPTRHPYASVFCMHYYYGRTVHLVTTVATATIEGTTAVGV